MDRQYRNIQNWTPWFVLLIVVLSLAGVGLANNLVQRPASVAVEAQ